MTRVNASSGHVSNITADQAEVQRTTIPVVIAHFASRATSKSRRTSHATMVGEVGLEPTKAKPADLQSAPFAARDIPPAQCKAAVGKGFPFRTRRRYG